MKLQYCIPNYGLLATKRLQWDDSLNLWVTTDYSYDAYGNITAETHPENRGRYAWTGRDYDQATGLQYNHARYYDPQAGRWMGECHSDGPHQCQRYHGL